MASTTTEPATTASPIDAHAAPTADTKKRSGKATASFVVGVIGLLASPIPFLGLILGVVAIALGATSRTEARAQGKTNVWMAVAGLALGALAVAISIGIFVVGIVIST